MRIDLFQQIRDGWVFELWSGRLTTKSLSELSVTIHPAIGVVFALPPLPSNLSFDREALLSVFPLLKFQLGCIFCMEGGT